MDTIRNKSKKRIMHDILNMRENSDETKTSCISDHLKKIIKKNTQNNLCLKTNKELVNQMNREIQSFCTNQNLNTQFTIYEIRSISSEQNKLFEVHDHGTFYCEHLRRPKKVFSKIQMEKWLNETKENKILIM